LIARGLGKRSTANWHLQDAKNKVKEAPILVRKENGGRNIIASQESGAEEGLELRQ